MKEFKIYFSDVQSYCIVIPAENLEDAKERFEDYGEWDIEDAEDTDSGADYSLDDIEELEDPKVFDEDSK